MKTNKTKDMSGLAKICKAYGRITVKSNGKTVIWIYDYALDKPRREDEMTKDEIKASEKAKYNKIAFK